MNQDMKDHIAGKHRQLASMLRDDPNLPRRVLKIVKELLDLPRTDSLDGRHAIDAAKKALDYLPDGYLED